MEKRSVADRQVEKRWWGETRSGDNFYLQHGLWLITNLNIKQYKQYKQSCKVKCCSWIFKCCITSVAKLMRNGELAPSPPLGVIFQSDNCCNIAAPHMTDLLPIDSSQPPSHFLPPYCFVSQSSDNFVITDRASNNKKMWKERILNLSTLFFIFFTSAIFIFSDYFQ